VVAIGLPPQRFACYLSDLLQATMVKAARTAAWPTRLHCVG